MRQNNFRRNRVYVGNDTLMTQYVTGCWQLVRAVSRPTSFWYWHPETQLGSGDASRAGSLFSARSRAEYTSTELETT